MNMGPCRIMSTSGRQISLLREFCRIDGKSSMTALLDDGLQYADAIGTLAIALKKRPKLLDAVLAQISLQKQEAERKELRRRASIMTIATLLNEKLTDMQF